MLTLDAVRKSFNDFFIYIAKFHARDLSDARKDVEKTLLTRFSFPSEKWIELGFNLDCVKSVLDFISKETDLPNNHFEPCDSAYFLFTEGYFDMDITWLISSLKRRYRHEITSAMVGNWVEQGRHVCDVVAFLLNQDAGVGRNNATQGGDEGTLWN